MLKIYFKIFFFATFDKLNFRILLLMRAHQNKKKYKNEKCTPSSQQQQQKDRLHEKKEEKEIRQIIYNFFAAFNFFSSLPPNMEDKLSLPYSLSSKCRL